MSMLEIAFGKGTTDPPSGSVVDSSSLEPETLEPLVDDSNA